MEPRSTPVFKYSSVVFEVDADEPVDVAIFAGNVVRVSVAGVYNEFEEHVALEGEFAAAEAGEVECVGDVASLGVDAGRGVSEIDRRAHCGCNLFMFLAYMTTELPILFAARDEHRRCHCGKHILM